MWFEQHRRRSRRNPEGVDVGGLRLIRDQVLPLDLAVKPAEATKEEQNGEGYLWLLYYCGHSLVVDRQRILMRGMSYAANDHVAPCTAAPTGNTRQRAANPE